MNGDNTDRGTVAELWRLYGVSAEWKGLAEATRADYTQCSIEVLRVFGPVSPAAIKPAMIHRYLRHERAAAPVRANREAALLSNLLNIAVERGDIETNPCRQVRRNKERPRQEAPEVATLVGFLAWAAQQKGQAAILAGMAEFAALSGSRRIEFRELAWPHVGEMSVRLTRAKQRGRETVEVLERSAALDDLLVRMRALAKDDRMGYVFPTVAGNAYTDSGFKGMWNRLVLKALEEKAIDKRFTFHDLRAYHVTQHKAQRGALPDLHANPGTTARVYDRTKEVKRRAL